jgi:AhpD family alkylhydroperoxidase
MLAVSRLNGCRYCSWGHYEWAQISGVSNEELAQVEQLDPAGFDRRKWVAISYVRALVKGNFVRVQPELRRAMQHKYSPREIRQIELIANVMDVGNRGSNTFDAMLSRFKGVPATDSRIVDEVILSGMFLAIAPVVLVHLARASKRPIREVARSLIDYTKNYEERFSAAGAPK